MTTENIGWFSFSGPIEQSILFLLLLFTIRHFVKKRIHDSKIDRSQDQRLRALGSLQNTLSIAVIFGLLYIWAETLSVFALSLFTVALAIVTALKELLMCIHGYVLIIRNKFYHMGDRIKINETQGDVIDINFLSTTILEIGLDHQKTGREISFANSLLLNRAVQNESLFENFAMITLTVPLHYTQNWQKAKKFLLEIARQECEPFLDLAGKKIREGQKRLGIAPSPIEPQISIDLPNYEKIVLHLRLPCPLQQRETVEQSILSRFMEKMASSKS